MGEVQAGLDEISFLVFPSIYLMTDHELAGAEHILLISQSQRSCTSVLFADWARSRNSLVV